MYRTLESKYSNVVNFNNVYKNNEKLQYSNFHLKVCFKAAFEVFSVCTKCKRNGRIFRRERGLTSAISLLANTRAIIQGGHNWGGEASTCNFMVVITGVSGNVLIICRICE